jgi:PAS domain S-box-containing protein
MSAHVWYRASLASQDESLAVVDAPETVAMDKVVSNDRSNATTRTSWAYASSFLPTAWDQQVTMVDAPETALGSVTMEEYLHNSTTTDTQVDANLIQETVGPYYRVMFAVDQPETALGAVPLSDYLDKDTLDSFTQHQQEEQQHDTISLPVSLQDYYETAANDNRAMVVTKIESPHRIVDVNDAWIGLCGYTRGESIDRSLGDLLQGQDTEPHALDDFLMKVRNGQTATATITNYTKNGRKFVNRVHAGPLKDEHDVITHFVGVLQEVQDKNTIKA